MSRVQRKLKRKRLKNGVNFPQEMLKSKYPCPNRFLPVYNMYSLYPL